MKASRAGLIKKSKPNPTVEGLVLDREINDEDIWLIQIGEKRMVVNKTLCSKLNGTGKVLMRFIGKSGSNVERFNI
jgi:hypothetical protein